MEHEYLEDIGIKLSEGTLHELAAFSSISCEVKAADFPRSGPIFKKAIRVRDELYTKLALIVAGEVARQLAERDKK